MLRCLSGLDLVKAFAREVAVAVVVVQVYGEKNVFTCRTSFPFSESCLLVRLQFFSPLLCCAGGWLTLRDVAIVKNRAVFWNDFDISIL